MSSDVVIPLVAAFIASILTIIGSLVVARYQAGKAETRETACQAHEHGEARLLDERNLRDAKRERLRRDYVDIAFAADNFQSASIQLTMLWAGDTPEARGERIQAQLKDATDDLGRAIIRLQLEEGTQPIVEAYKRVRGNWLQYQYEVVEADRKHDHTQVAETMQTIEADVKAIIATAKADLDRLGKPNLRARRYARHTPTRCSADVRPTGLPAVYQHVSERCRMWTYVGASLRA